MNNFTLVGLAAIVLFSLSGCNKERTDTAITEDSPGNPASGLNIPGITDESALKIISDNAHLIRCGDRYIKEGDFTNDELKDLTFQISPIELTQADSLNGITWFANISFHTTAIRSYIPKTSGNERWSDWVNSENPYRNYKFIVRNGKLEPHWKNPFPKAIEINCSNIPNEQQPQTIEAQSTVDAAALEPNNVQASGSDAPCEEGTNEIPALGSSYNDGIYLCRETVESYWNEWYASRTSKDKLHVQSEGKTSGFSGVLTINCNTGSSFWTNATDFDEPLASENDIAGVVPLQVVNKAKQYLCKGLTTQSKGPP